MDTNEPNWIVRHYTGAEWPIIKGNGIELECAGADREQAEAIASRLNRPVAADAQPVARPDQNEFERQATHQGARNFTLALGMKCANGWEPATYACPETELAWRVWANKGFSPSPTTAPASESIDSTAFLGRAIAAAVEAIGIGPGDEWNSFIAHINAHTAAQVAAACSEMLKAANDRIAQVAASKPAESDSEEDAYVIDRLGKLLAGVAVALKGPEPALTRWSYHDLPDIAAKAMLELEIFRAAEVAASKAPVAAAPDDTKRLDFVLDRQAFILTIPAEQSINARECYQLMEQDEDEDFHAISGENVAYGSKRAAIDAAMTNASEGGEHGN